MLTLGISSATKIISVGLVDDNKMFFNYIEAAEKLQSENLTEYIKELLKRANLNIKDIEAIAVAQGPGSYGGLRGGMATAKTLSHVLKIPIVGVSTLEAMAYNLIDNNALVIVFLDAKKEEYNVSVFGINNKKLDRKAEDFVIDHKRLIQMMQELSPDTYIMTSISLLHQELTKYNIKLVSLEKSYPLGSNIAYLGRKKILAGKKDDIFTLTPNYSYEPNIREYAKKGK